MSTSSTKTIPNPCTPTFRVLSLCSGLGALDLALGAFGGRTVCYVEKNPSARLVLESRIVTHDLDHAPIEHDVHCNSVLRFKESECLPSSSLPDDRECDLTGGCPVCKREVVVLLDVTKPKPVGPKPVRPKSKGGTRG